MCYNIAYYEQKIEKLKQRYEAGIPDAIVEHLQKPVFHVSGFSHPFWPVLTSEQPHQFSLLRWGLIPFWIKSKEEAKIIQERTLNCISETAFEKPSFRTVIKSKRCIIPITAFYEWQTIGKNKYPYVIQQEKDEIISLAGVYDQWVDKETGEILNTFSILTCAANELLAKIHNSKKRMPLILPKEREIDWLNMKLNREEVEKLFQPIASGYLKAHTISKLITSRTQNPDVAEVLHPHTYLEIIKE